MSGSGQFRGTAPVPSGTGQVTVQATDPAGNVRTNVYELTQAGATKSFTYDANGNLTSDGVKTYFWDAANRLVEVKQGTTTLAAFTYDGEGLRASKTAGGVTISYVYDGPQFLEERPSTGSAKRYAYGLGIDQPLAQVVTGTPTYNVADHLGSIVRTTDAAGNPTLTREYDPWGNPVQGAGTSGYAFTGREWDPEIEAYYYRARYYNPKIGRFISEDQIGFTGGVNFYSYVANNPTNLVDPSGLIIQLCARPAQGMPGNHAYLYDPGTGRDCGRGDNSGKECPFRPDTTCVNVPGTQGLEDVVMACCQAQRQTPWSSPGMWRPFINDCHNFNEDVFKCAGIQNPPSSPGGRFGSTRQGPSCSGVF